MLGGKFKGVGKVRLNPVAEAGGFAYIKDIAPFIFKEIDPRLGGQGMEPFFGEHFIIYPLTSSFCASFDSTGCACGSFLYSISSSAKPFPMSPPISHPLSETILSLL
jgi:hypothetical protein